MTRTAAVNLNALAAVLIQLALAGLLPAGARAASSDAAATAAATATDASDNRHRIEGCITAAARVYRLPPAMLVILLNVEGGSLGRVSQNTNDTVDIGPMQVNQIWIPLVAAHWHATAAAAFRALRDNFCANVEAGAWILRHGLDEAGGDFWQGVGFYHSHDPDEKERYLRAVLRQAIRLQALAVRPAAAVHSQDAPAGELLGQASLLPAGVARKN
jgi:hypothetical protein